MCILTYIIHVGGVKLDVGNLIKTLRKQQNMTASELGQAIGKDRATIYRYENGDIGDLPISVILPLAKKLNVSPFYLLGWEQDLSLPPSLATLIKDPELMDLLNKILQLTPSERKQFIQILDNRITALQKTSDQ